MLLLPGAGSRSGSKVGVAFAFCKNGCTRHCKLPVFAGVLQVSFTFHVNRSHLFLIAPAKGGRLALLRSRRCGRCHAFRRGARQRLAEFHHLSLEAFRPWPRAGVQRRVASRDIPKVLRDVLR